MNVAAIVLAAGSSRRMGRDKLALPYGAATVLESVIRSVMRSRASSVTVVAGGNLPQVARLAAALGFTARQNPRPADGMLSSIQHGIEAAAPDSDAYLILLGDQPGIRSEVIDSVIEAASSHDRGIVQPVFDGKRGHPVLLRAVYRQEILSLPLTYGLNEILRRHPDDVLEVPVDSPLILEDIDTPEDYSRALEAMKRPDAS